MNCIPGFNTAQLKELLQKLKIPAVEEVPGLTILEAVKVSYPDIYHVIQHCYIVYDITVLY